MQDKQFSLSENFNEIIGKNKYCAGLDLSSSFHCAFLPPHLITKDEANFRGGMVRNFDTTTTDLQILGKTFKEHGVKEVVMEATGIYWFGVFEILDQMGFSVYVVNPKHAANIAGRKTDEGDAEWLCRLHTFGLLRNSFIPPRDIWPVRSLLRQRSTLISDRSRYALRMQKELDAMNVKIHKAISDITGSSGLKILNLIAQGVPDLQTDWLQFHSKRMKVSEEDFVKSLQGSFTPTRCFLLSQHLSAYHSLSEQIKALDQLVEQHLFCKTEGVQLEDLEKQAPKNDFIRPLLSQTGKRLTSASSKNAPLYDQTHYLEQLLGVDASTIPGIGPQSVLELIGELGTDLKQAFPSAGHFTSWAQLSPNNKISAGKKVGTKRVTNANKVHQIFRECAFGLSGHKGYFGQFYRNLKVRSSGKKANKALARKLAVIFYNVITKKEVYDETKVVTKTFSKEKIIKRLRKKAAQQGYELILAKAS